MIDIRKKQIAELKGFIPVLEHQYIAINSVNTGAGIASIVGTGLFFTQFFLAGAAILGVSTATSVITTVGDAVATNVRSDRVSAIMGHSYEMENEFKGLMAILERNVDKVLKETNWSWEDSLAFVLRCLTTGLTAGTFLSAVADAAANDPKTFSVVVTNTTRSFALNTVTAGSVTRNTVSVTRTAKSAKTAVTVAKPVASTATKVLGALGVAFTIADIVIGWKTGNQCLEKLKELLPVLEQSVVDLETFLYEISSNPPK